MVDLSTIHTKKNHLETLTLSDPEILAFCVFMDGPWKMAHFFGWNGILFLAVSGGLFYFNIGIWPFLLGIGVALIAISIHYKTLVLAGIEKKYGEVTSDKKYDPQGMLR